jgi:hypothetical protein
MFFFFFENRAGYEMVWKNNGTARQAAGDNIGRMCIDAGYLRLQIRTQNIQYLLIFHSTIGYRNAPLCYAVRTLPVKSVQTSDEPLQQCKWGDRTIRFWPDNMLSNAEYVY